jgi:hypothetical protein
MNSVGSGQLSRNSQPSLDFGEDRWVGRVASKIMIKLAGAVVVAGSCGKQPEAIRQLPQPPPGVGIMILMVDLEAVQPVITDEALQHVWW